MTKTILNRFLAALLAVAICVGLVFSGVAFDSAYAAGVDEEVVYL